MRILGELIVVLGVAMVAIEVSLRKWVRPAQRRRAIEKLEEENERLDRLLDANKRKERSWPGSS